MFNPFSWFRKSKEKEGGEAPKKIEKSKQYIPAKNWVSTADADHFIKQLTSLDEKDFFAAKAYNIAKLMEHPQCLEMRLTTEVDEVGSFNAYSEIVCYSYKKGKWFQDSQFLRSNGVATTGNVDEFISVAAANGWNCTIPATEIMMAFIGTIVKTQSRNKSKNTPDKTVVVVKFYMPWKAVPPKIRVSAFDPNSMVGENLAPSILIPFIAARKPAQRNNVEKTI